MRYAYIYASFLMLVFCTSCGGEKKAIPPDKNIKSETKDTVTSPGSNASNFHTKYEYIDATGKGLIIQNSFPRGEQYTGPNGKQYVKVIFWTRIINETDSPLEWMIDFSGDSYEFPCSVGGSGVRYYKLLVPPDTMTRDKEGMFNYGMTDLNSFLVNAIDKPSSLKRTILPKESSGFYVVGLGSILKPDRADCNGVARAGFSIKGQDLFYTLNGKEIHCGSISLKNLILKDQRTINI